MRRQETQAFFLEPRPCFETDEGQKRCILS